MTAKVIHPADMQTIKVMNLRSGDILMEGVIYDVSYEDDTVFARTIFGTLALRPFSTVQVLARIGEEMLPGVLEAIREQKDLDPDDFRSSSITAVETTP